jgi:flavin reductase (DIM6/NTAB) family NADH-FMN oxidoreductase RutF
VTGVSVVTFSSGDEVRGITINSFTSVSLDPPLILICIAKRARAHDHLLRCRRFCVNVLSTSQRSIAEHFAGRRAENRDAVFEPNLPGTSRLAGALAYLNCSLALKQEAGDHTIFIAHVDDVEVTREGDPLLFFAGDYTRLAPRWPWAGGALQALSIPTVSGT